MNHRVNVIKRNARSWQDFSRDKLFKSIFTACLSVHEPEKSAQLTANAVCAKTISWLQNHPEVTASDIRRTASRALQNFNQEAAYFYSQHKHIL